MSTTTQGPVPTSFAVLVRDPAEAVRRALGGHDAVPLVRTALLAVLVGGTIYGGVLGTYRGELQVAFAALKMPLALLATLVVTAPALWALGASAGRRWTLRVATALTLVAAGRAALVLTALSPLLWLAIDLGAGYHFSTFLAAVTFALAGLTALGALLRGLGGPRGVGPALLSACVFLAALSQTSWVLRPWLGRPSQPVVFVRTEAGVGPLSAVASSARLGWSDPTGLRIEGSSL